MADYLLVHGAMHGGWCWRQVRDLLTRHGHRVLAPSLTGQGEHRRRLTPEVGVATHVDDLTDLLWYEDLTDVRLVLHSYAGILAGPVAERAGDRLAAVVFLGAFVVRPGQCLLDVEPPDVARRYRERVAEAGSGWYLLADASFLAQWGVRDERLRAWAGPRLTDFPFRCQTDPVHFDPRPLDALRKVYVQHTEPFLPSLQPSLDAARAGGWDIRTIPCGHDMMLEAPEATARLLEAASGPPPSPGPDRP
ncbi:alpha/beta fold hydrolase [Streptomyces formicae]|uniref:Alpha/beta fold hydrolase n=1 Tax=Streptomyces formicae TaxID=1616117 RepID=A0ABY3WUZ5_9ACTN|nr:alpha/beta fold hydrolase [Streptomyces formicae]UNM15279.1 alpha/beta fold hydrolase [Streptomyces formicae]